MAGVWWIVAGCAAHDAAYRDYLGTMERLNRGERKPLVELSFNEAGGIRSLAVHLPDEPVRVEQRRNHPGWGLAERVFGIAFPVAAQVAGMAISARENRRMVEGIVGGLADRGPGIVTNITGSYNTENSSTETVETVSSWENRVADSFNRSHEERVSTWQESHALTVQDSFQDHSVEGSFNPVTVTETNETDASRVVYPAAAVGGD